MKKNKLILFDWGNIVESYKTGYSFKKAWIDLFDSCGYNKEDLFTKLEKYELTGISNMDVFAETYSKMKEDFNLDKDLWEFINLYNYYFSKVEFYQEVVDYELSLHDRCYIGIFSNISILDKQRLDEQVGLSNYDYAFLSCEMGLRKPTVEAFKYILNKVPFKPNDILFIDDKKNNIETANSLGYNTLQATGLELDLIKEKCEAFLKEE